LASSTSPSTATEPAWLTARRERAVSLTGSLPLPSFRGNPGWEFTSLKNVDLDAYGTPDPVDLDASGLGVFAAPAGAVIWLISNIHVGGASLAVHAIHSLDPVAILIGLNGVILLAYVVAIPANEIVIPTVLMLTVLTAGPEAGAGAGAGVMFELDSVQATGEVLRAGGWTLLTGVCLMLFSLLHNPCSTTIYTIYKETRSAKWTTVATLMPVAMGVVVCFLVAQVWRLLA